MYIPRGTSRVQIHDPILIASHPAARLVEPVLVVRRQRARAVRVVVLRRAVDRVEVHEGAVREALLHEAVEAVRHDRRVPDVAVELEVFVVFVSER